MRDTWIGSGILARDGYMSFYCEPCEKWYDLDGQTDDTGYVAYSVCTVCNNELQEDIWPE